MSSGTDQTSESLLGLHWLIRLRWIAAFGYALVSVIVSLGLHIRLPATLLSCCIAVIVISNFLLDGFRRGRGNCPPWSKAMILSMDVVLLTVMLFFTGGAHNPFTMFYLLHVTLAVILLPPWGAWGTVALCTVGFWTLFYSDHALESTTGSTCCSDMTAHLQGMVVGMVLTGCGIAYFVSRLTAGLRHSRRMIEMARTEGERARRSMEVATLAAGIAHELATPLGTIAVVSQDLENLAGTMCENSCCKEDAKVIRQEVERCRKIIEKLGSAGHAPDESLKPLDWEHLGELLAGYLPDLIRDRLEVRVVPSPKRPLFATSRLLQCLGILVKNAAEASPAELPVLLEASISGEQCEFRVTDQGVGFPPELVDRIGEPLVTTKSKHGGLGLGLYLVKSFARDCGGGLAVDSGAGKPTRVTLRLPSLESVS